MICCSITSTFNYYLLLFLLLLLYYYYFFVVNNLSTEAAKDFFFSLNSHVSCMTYDDVEVIHANLIIYYCYIYRSLSQLINYSAHWSESIKIRSLLNILASVAIGQSFTTCSYCLTPEIQIYL